MDQLRGSLQIDSKFAPDKATKNSAGAVAYWHVTI